jgi:hypothetical protein
VDDRRAPHFVKIRFSNCRFRRPPVRAPSRGKRIPCGHAAPGIVPNARSFLRPYPPRPHRIKMNVVGQRLVISPLLSLHQHCFVAVPKKSDNIRKWIDQGCPAPRLSFSSKPLCSWAIMCLPSRVKVRSLWAIISQNRATSLREAASSLDRP